MQKLKVVVKINQVMIIYEIKVNSIDDASKICEDLKKSYRK